MNSPQGPAPEVSRWWRLQIMEGHTDSGENLGFKESGKLWRMVGCCDQMAQQKVLAIPWWEAD